MADIGTRPATKLQSTLPPPTFPLSASSRRVKNPSPFGARQCVLDCCSRAQVAESQDGKPDLEHPHHAQSKDRGAGHRAQRSAPRSRCRTLAPAYVSPVAYQSYTCQQLALEAQSISTRAAKLSGAQDKQRTNDGLATAAAVVIFWPAAFFVGGDKLSLLAV